MVVASDGGDRTISALDYESVFISFRIISKHAEVDFLCKAKQTKPKTISTSTAANSFLTDVMMTITTDKPPGAIGRPK